ARLPGRTATRVPAAAGIRSSCRGTPCRSSRRAAGRAGLPSVCESLDAARRRRMIALPLTEVFVPDGDEARRWAGEELAKHEYQAAKPTWFDEAVTAVVDWFFGLFTDKGAGNVAPAVVTLIVIVVIAALVVALLVWGRPRASRTVRRRAELLGERD